jgi:hypothetical protein
VTGNYDEVATQWTNTDIEHEKEFKKWMKTCIETHFSEVDENGDPSLTFEDYEEIETFGQCDFNISGKANRSGKLLWPALCYDFADRYRGEGTEKLNWAWINKHFPNPKDCKSMFHDPMTVSVFELLFFHG